MSPAILPGAEAWSTPVKLPTVRSWEDGVMTPMSPNSMQSNRANSFTGMPGMAAPVNRITGSSAVVYASALANR